MNGKLNKYAYNITGRVVSPIKYLDGAMRVPVWIKTYTGGEAVHERVELYCDCMGNWSIINNK